MAVEKKVSPVRQQYLDIKAKFPDAILFFRLGDFYETFDQDAELVSSELDIVLTSRNVSKGNRVPMAGVPHHAAENYLARLIDKGFHIAICEQVGTEPINGLMPREVVRIITPGTVMSPGLLPGDANNYLVSVIQSEGSAGLAYTDVSTGEFSATEFEDEAGLLAEVSRLNAAEIIIPENSEIQQQLKGHSTEWPAWRYETGKAIAAIKEQFEVATLEAFGLKGKTLAAQAAGALIQYLQESQAASLASLQTLNFYSVSDFMNLDRATRRNLEITETIGGGKIAGSLLSVLDRCVTPMGRRLFRKWLNRPLLQIKNIQKRQDAVAYFVDHGMLRSEFRTKLKTFSDVERLTNRIMNGSAQPHALKSLKQSLHDLPEMRVLFSESKSPMTSLLSKIKVNKKVMLLLENALADDAPAILGKAGIFKTGYSNELDEILEATRESREWIANLEKNERSRTGIRVLKVGFNKVHGYYIEVTKSNTAAVPENYIRKQTLVNAERYITPELKEMELLVLNAEERIIAVETKLFHDLCRQLAKFSEELLEMSRSIAALDALANLAEVAALEGFVRPDFVEKDLLEIHNGRHLVVEKHLNSGHRFVPNDAIFEANERIRIITGPNMSGKSTYLRQVALIVLMAQIGSYVPAERVRMGIVDRIFTRIGAQDEIHAGQSTFMVEMVETANILNHATARSLLILDEIGRGTSTYDGLSIAWAVVEYIHNHPKLQSKTIFATHFHELTQLAEQLNGVRNYNVAVSEADGKVVFLHRIIKGGADRSYGIHVGQLAGLPKMVILRAQEILNELESSAKGAKKKSEFNAKQEALFPESSPILEELDEMDVDSMAPIEALNKLFEWKKKFNGKQQD